MLGMSISEIEFDTYIVKLKPEYNNVDFIFHIQGEFSQLIGDYTSMAPSENGRWQNWYRMLSWEGVHRQEHERKSNNLEKVFVIITIVAMALCFFSLSSSMSANIME